MTNRVIPIKLADNFVVEAVYYGSGTLCISTQVGCAVGCPFCASGAKGFFRNLSLDEVLVQIESARKECVPERITLSGIGEPLHNWKVAKQIIESLDLPVSVTTTGYPFNRLRELLSSPHNGVMLSVHSAIPVTHKQLVPRGPDVDELFQVLREEWGKLSRNKRRKVGFNYLLVDGVNVSNVELEAMQNWMSHFPEATLHLLLCNNVDHANFRSPSDDRLQDIYRQFREKGINTRRANNWRRREDGGCGTLMVRGLSEGE